MPESRRQNEWTEGVAIWIAVSVVSCVGELICLDTCSNHYCAAACSCQVTTFAEAALRDCSSCAFPATAADWCKRRYALPWCSANNTLPWSMHLMQQRLLACSHSSHTHAVQPLADPTCCRLPTSAHGQKVSTTAHHKPSMNPTCCGPAAGAGNDYQKDRQFRELNAKKDELKIKVVRDGTEFLIPNTEVVVGDLLKLETGDKIAADGLCVESHNLVVDEASLTGESDPLKKGFEDPFVRAGTQVSSACDACMTC